MNGLLFGEAYTGASHRSGSSCGSPVVLCGFWENIQLNQCFTAVLARVLQDKAGPPRWRCMSFEKKRA